jgi:RND family efflux transporter MFP subunit
VNRRRFIWLALALGFLVAGGYYLYARGGAASWLTNQSDSQGEASQEGAAQRAVARIGDLEVSVGGSGELVSTAETGLDFPEGGVLTELSVGVGDQVGAGDILARLQVDETQAQRQSEIASAELAVLNAQQSLDQLYASAQVDAAQAQIALEDAQSELEDLQDTQPEQATAQEAIAQAQEAVEQAEMNLYILKSSPSQEAYDIANSALLFKEKELNEIKGNVEQLEFQIKAAPSRTMKENLRMQLLDLQVRLANQQLVVDKAVYKLESLDDQADPVDLELAQAQLKTAQAQLEAAQTDLAQAQAGPSAGEIKTAQAKVDQAEVELRRLQDGPDPDDLALAKATLQAAQTRLDVARNQAQVLDLVAPMDGQIISVEAAVGERVSGQTTILTLAGASQPALEVYLDESDMSQVQVGYPVEVVFDALPERTFTGRVAQIYPQLVRQGGASALGALIRLDETPLGGTKTLPLGLNASVTVIAGRTEGAVLIPIEALHEIASSPDSGLYAVYVFNGQDIQRREVTVGLKDYTSAEILQGLQAGETVLLGNIEGVDSQNPGQLESEP